MLYICYHFFSVGQALRKIKGKKKKAKNGSGSDFFGSGMSSILANAVRQSHTTDPCLFIISID